MLTAATRVFTHTGLTGRLRDVFRNDKLASAVANEKASPVYQTNDLPEVSAALDTAEKNIEELKKTCLAALTTLDHRKSQGTPAASPGPSKRNIQQPYGPQLQPPGFNQALPPTKYQGPQALPSNRIASLPPTSQPPPPLGFISASSITGTPPVFPPGSTGASSINTSHSVGTA
ncbi:hypothetical protein LTR08_006872 [Meristemomyces frigidus]|nr:hypothetical protein LTR08_006872 [Meristemomyces frigidus]